MFLRIFIELQNQYFLLSPTPGNMILWISRGIYFENWPQFGKAKVEGVELSEGKEGIHCGVNFEK